MPINFTVSSRRRTEVKSRISLSLSRTLHSRPLPSALCPLALFPLPSRLLALSPSRLSPLASRPLPSALCPLPSCPLALFPLPSRPLALSPSRPLTLSPLALSPSPLSASRLQFLFSTKPQPQGTPQAAVQPLPQAAFIPCRKLPFNHAVGRCRSTVLERGISSSQGFHRHWFLGRKRALRAATAAVDGGCCCWGRGGRGVCIGMRDRSR
ncbi:hypothetical protein LR48_Vigan07g165700 [Vigna angularis]|uniref:Uncharacterized protein n=1 Tax=Phaseolus angularis TaxID=3914 RepID=A0A0L9UYX3_PHAAN|nr:hypothetical protein LR48_Vigan07g165700 [Vigna angularis]